jgi:hypothetical protein
MKSKQCVYLTEDQLTEAGLTPEDVGSVVSFMVTDDGSGQFVLEKVKGETEVESGETEDDMTGSESESDMAAPEEPVSASAEEAPTSPALDGQEDSPVSDREESLLGYTRPKKKKGAPVDMAKLRSGYRFE